MPKAIPVQVPLDPDRPIGRERGAHARSIAYITDMVLATEIHFMPHERLIFGMNDAARKAGRWIDFVDGSVDLRAWVRTKKHLEYGGFIGTISGSPAREAAWATLDRTFPCVRCMTPSPSARRYVGIDEGAGMDLLVQHLHSEGFRRIGYCALGDDSYHRDRRDAFLAAVKVRGLPWDDRWLYSFNPAREAPADDHQIQLARIAGKVARQLVKEKPGLEAMVCPDDLLARLLEAEVRRAGMRVPHDLALTGFDDQGDFMPEARGITSVHQDWRRIGSESVHLLVECLDRKKRPEPRTILIPPELVVRRSSLKRSLGTLHDGAFRERAYEYLEAHFADVRAMRRIHEAFGLGREHFQTRFRRAFGRSMLDLVGSYRLSKAAERLKYGTAPIIDIYLECGFGTHQHFISMFRRAYGVTPSVFRASAGKDLPKRGMGEGNPGFFKCEKSRNP